MQRVDTLKNGFDTFNKCLVHALLHLLAFILSSLSFLNVVVIVQITSTSMSKRLIPTLLYCMNWITMNCDKSSMRDVVLSQKHDMTGGGAGSPSHILKTHCSKKDH